MREAGTFTNLPMRTNVAGGSAKGEGKWHAREPTQVQNMPRVFSNQSIRSFPNLSVSIHSFVCGAGYVQTVLKLF